MSTRLYSNENFPLPVVVALRALGHDVLTSLDAGNANDDIPDDEVLRFATAENRAVLTHNRKDFIRLHNQHSEHAGMIACTVDADFPALTARIHAHIGNRDSLRNQLIRINRNSH